MSIRWVRQEHDKGCGYAALAMLTGQTYAQVLSDFGQVLTDNPEYQYDPRTGSPFWQHMDRYLEEHGFAVARKFARRMFSEHPQWPPAPFADAHLCNVRVHAEATVNHWVVMLGNGSVLDPMTPNEKRLTDYVQVHNVAGVCPVEAKS